MSARNCLPGIAYLIAGLCLSCFGQTPNATSPSAIESAVGQEAHIIINPGRMKPLAFLFAASARAKVTVGEKELDQSIQVHFRIVQGDLQKSESISLGLGGTGDVIDVEGESIASWAVRTVGSQRFLDLLLKPVDVIRQDDEKARHKSATVRIRSKHQELPAAVQLAHLMPGSALGFDSEIQIQYAAGVTGTITAAEGFSKLVSNQRIERLQTATGGRLELRLSRSTALAPDVELLETSITGELYPNGKSVSFQLRGMASIRVHGARLRVLSGNVALSKLPENPDVQIALLSTDTGPVYELIFPKAGNYPISLDFVSALKTDPTNWQVLDFTVAASSVVPIQIRGLDTEIEFARDAHATVPILVDHDWHGYLPASGHALLRWQNARSAGEGKSFFTTSAAIETTIGPGLLRQEHRIDYQLLQGQLKSLSIQLKGPGEILNVDGDHIVAWKVVDDGDNRLLEITLNQPLTAHSRVTVFSQTPLGTFPVRVEGLSVQPRGAIRNSGFLRISNNGSVSAEPTNLRGLTQLAPEQFPTEAIQSRQQFVYRFPSADYAFTIVADRIQPEVSVTQLVLYQISESDRVISADIELDIREATIRDWNLLLPSDYSIVSVTGANVSDFVASSEVTDNRRNLKILFNQDLQGRHLLSLRLEKNEVAATGQWRLPHISFPDAKTVRGDIGVVAAPGFRASVGTMELLVEKPLSYFPKPIPNLQQAFRIREPGWNASIQIEQLERSIQSDVFHLYSLSQGTAYGSALINYTITGAPVAELRLTVPASLGNVTVDGQEIRTWRRDGETLTVSLQQSILGPYTLLVTFEEKPNVVDGSFQPGLVAPLGVQGDRGYIEVVSPVQVELESLLVSSQLLVLDSLELPAEFRLLSTAPALGTWQYTQRPFDLRLKVKWFDPGTTTAQVVEFSEANSRVSQDGEQVTDVLYYVKSRGQHTLKLQLPGDPVRLWAVSVNGRPVTARQAGDETWIPLPGGVDPNEPIEVSLRLGKSAEDQGRASLQLPVVFAPVLKTQWNLSADENYALVPRGGSVDPTIPVAWPNGFDWLAGRGLAAMSALAILGMLLALSKSFPLKQICLVLTMVVSGIAGWHALNHLQPPAPLQLSLPVLASGESVGLDVANLPVWRAYVSWPGLAMMLIGLLLASLTWRIQNARSRWFGYVIAFGLLACGLLLQYHGALAFFAIVLVVGLWQFVPPMIDQAKRVGDFKGQAAKEDSESRAAPPDGTAIASPILVLLTGSLALFQTGVVQAEDDVKHGSTPQKARSSELESMQSASSMHQNWNVSHRDKRLTVSAEVQLSGRPGDRFVLLRAPGVLTRFDGPGLRLGKLMVPNHGVTYIVTIPTAQVDEDNGQVVDQNANNKPSDHRTSDETQSESGQAESLRSHKQFKASFQYQLDGIQTTVGIPVLTGSAALQQIDLRHDEKNWEVVCDSAARIEMIAEESSEPAPTARVKLLLGPGSANVVLRPQSRDLNTEATQFFVEGACLYTPGPGVIDGKHRLKIRTSQGRVQQLGITIPNDLTVSSVEGPITFWQFDADNHRLHVQIDPTVRDEFTLTVDTQRGLDALPTMVQLWPLRVEKADGEVGLIALAFGSEAQPENVQADNLSLVNLGDFDASMITQAQTSLHRVYRYGTDMGSISVLVAPVASEVRVSSKQVISLGDERVVLAIQFLTEITRTGLFQLSFPLPAGMEVETLTGDSLHHWSELTEKGQRQILLHLKGKTIGPQVFSLTLAGPVPTEANDWQIPRFELNESTRQSGELVLQPITGIRLRTISRQNVSEADPRSMGAKGQGALAFRLLQRDWNLNLSIEKLAPWVTGQVLHDVTMREGQTRSVILADFSVQNAAIRSLTIKLPKMGADEIKTVRASGETVSDFVRSNEDDNAWELRFKRRVIGPVQFQIEYERRGERVGDTEALAQVEFPDARQMGYYFAVRAGGRLEIEHGTLTQGWQTADWSTVPPSLRQSGNRNAPAHAFRAMSPTTPLSLKVIRHSLAEALRLRVASGTLTTILSPTGDQLTSVDVNMEVIQRSSLSVQLPAEGELFSIFVNGESVHSIRQMDGSNAWQFYILPGIDDRTAHVRFVYTLTGDSLRKIRLMSPQLNVPLENIQWDVIVPHGYHLVHNQGNLELVGQGNRNNFDRQSYLSSLQGKRQDQAQQATRLLEQANQLLQTGEQSKAQWALNNVANRYALDAASNEDARVQLENLKTQQAIIGLNTRRQRLFLDNSRGGATVADNEQLRQAASANPILQQDQLSYRPQELSQLLAGNSKEDNATLQQIAGRLVQHQRTTEPAPQAILISLPEEGNVYSFRRSVQVAENAPLLLELNFNSQYKLELWQWALLCLLTVLLAVGLVRTKRLASTAK